MKERFRRWYRYEQESHAKVVESLRSVPDESRADTRYGKAIDLLDHLVAARWIWLYRLGAAPELVEPFPTGASLDEVAARLDEAHATWTAWLDELDDEKLASTFTYKALYGDSEFKSTVEDVLVQLFTHSIYHRGQIAQTVRALGGEPARADFIYWSQEKLG